MSETQEVWKNVLKLRIEGRRLFKEGCKLVNDGRKLYEEGDELYREVVKKEFGPGAVINWKTGKVTQGVK